MSKIISDPDQLIPPSQLVKDNNIGEGDFRAIGESMMQGLIERKLLNPNSSILDIGCGLGRLARPLVPFLSGGEYFGLDINRSSIDWCTSNYAAHSNFHFAWIDAHSKFYNPTGTVTGSQYKFSYSDHSFDFIMLTSVFTHMMIDDVSNYLSEIFRLLKPNGRCYATYFLLTRKLVKSFNRSPSQYFPIDGGFVADKTIPEKVVFLTEQRIRSLYTKHNLLIETVAFGNWSRNNRSRGGYQDEIVAYKHSGASESTWRPLSFMKRFLQR